MEFRLLAAMDGRSSAVLLHVRRVYRSRNAGQFGRQVRQKNNILRVCCCPTCFRSDRSFGEQVLCFPHPQISIRYLRFGWRLHNRIRPDDGTGRSNKEDGLRNNVSTGVRRWVHVSSRLGCRDQGQNVAANRLRASQRASHRPLVAHGRISALVVGSRARQRSVDYHTKRSEDEWQQRRYRYWKIDQRREDTADGSRGTRFLRSLGSLQNSESPKENVKRMPELVRQFHRLLWVVVERRKSRWKSIFDVVPQRFGGITFVLANVLPNGPYRKKMPGQYVHVDRRRVLYNRLQYPDWY